MLRSVVGGTSCEMRGRQIDQAPCEGDRTRASWLADHERFIRRYPTIACNGVGMVAGSPGATGKTTWCRHLASLGDSRTSGDVASQQRSGQPDAGGCPVSARCEPLRSCLVNLWRCGG
jgi:hypothetical protein